MATRSSGENPNAAPQRGSWDRSDPIQQEVSLGLKGLKKDIMGVISLGKDGIMRSLTADRRVLDAIPMTLEQINAFEQRLGADFPWKIGGSAGPNGLETPKEKWFQPDAGILPGPLRQESFDEIKSMSNEKKQALRERMRNDLNLVDVDGVLK
ncbi:hypothetical protein T440DRAFT_558389 [Plenodomus tracheiphilus IPT5]|uniref:Uncharacterized protein n=1 Tax=Plenodomus tracheiphilus IPT5 TaxID=1408161 RepID=A0A6A7AVL9_9PLEO|nr:hypothetical protein T440DRAFT_558389 [Plenodomus tracheiphilus IPT5]